jgi:hypothetical protein
MNRRLLSQQDLPEFEPVPLTLAMLVAEGMRLVQEQQMVNNTKLGEEYMVRIFRGFGGGALAAPRAWLSDQVVLGPAAMITACAYAYIFYCNNI